MEFLKHEEIASVSLFDLRLSEGELMVYESCLEFVVNNCNDRTIYSLTGCESKDELEDYRYELRKLIKKYVRKEYVPNKYKNKL